MAGLEADKRKRTSEEESAEESQKEQLISKQNGGIGSRILLDYWLFMCLVLSKSPPEQNKKGERQKEPCDFRRQTRFLGVHQLFCAAPPLIRFLQTMSEEDATTYLHVVHLAL